MTKKPYFIVVDFELMGYEPMIMYFDTEAEACLAAHRVNLGLVKAYVSEVECEEE